MYKWREMAPEERRAATAERRGKKFPWHSPPHLTFDGAPTFIITAACYEHEHIIGASPSRLSETEEALISLAEIAGALLYAWCILPNHYHILARAYDTRSLRREIGRFHGRSSRKWNLEDGKVGRKVWFNYFDRPMKSERHYWASLNYIHNNAVHHGYVEKWQDWPYSSSASYLETVGRDEAERVWNGYPILDYGKDWDVY
jgi:putative transposase